MAKAQIQTNPSVRLSRAKSIITALLPTKQPVLLVGAPGVGKTSIYKEIAKETNHDLIICHPILDDRVDYKGLPGIVDGNAEFLPFGILRQIMEADKPTIVFFDDLGQAFTDVQASIMQLVLGRELNGKKISDHVVFAAATNRKKDKAGVSGVLAPLLDRFAAVIPVDFHIDDWAAWMMKQGYDSTLVAYARMRPSAMVDVVASGEIEKTCTPRAVAGVGELLKLGITDALTLGCAAGNAWAAEFCAFRNVVESIPDINSIWKDPENAPVPTDNPIMYGLMASLAYHAEDEKVDALMTYLLRVPPQYAIVCLKDAAAKLPSMYANEKFGEWTNNNAAAFA